MIDEEKIQKSIKDAIESIELDLRLCSKYLQKGRISEAWDYLQDAQLSIIKIEEQFP